MPNLLRLSSALALALALSAVPACGPKNAALLTEEQAMNPTANFLSGVTALQTADRDGVIDYATAYDRFVKAEQLGAGAKASFNAGYVAEILGNPDGAATHYAKALEADPSYEAALYSYSRILDGLDRQDEAVALWQARVDANPGDLAFHNELVVALGRAERYDDAQVAAGEILLQDPQNVQCYRNLSSMYQAKGDFGMAELTSQKAASLMDTQDAGLLNNEGVAALVQGDEANAIQKFKAALEIHPTNFEANLNLGFIALNSGDYQLALTSFTSATDADPTSLDAKLGLAVALRGTNDYDRADGLYAAIIKADPTYDVAYFDAATLHEKYTRNYNKALKYLEAYIDAHGGQLSPDDEVYSAMQRVSASKAEEEARRAAEAERVRQEEERRQRNELLLSTMGTTVTSYQAKFTANAGCLDEGMAAEGDMILEQAQMVVEMADAGMAADIQMLLDGYTPGWDEAIAGCEAGGGAPTEAPAPEDVPADAPAP